MFSEFIFVSFEFFLYFISLNVFWNVEDIVRACRNMQVTSFTYKLCMKKFRVLYLLDASGKMMTINSKVENEKKSRL